MPAAQEHSPVVHLTAVVVGLTALLGIVVTAFAWPASELEPRALPVAVAPAPAAAPVETGLGRALGPGAFDVTAVDSREQALSLVRDREVYGALLVSPRGVEVLTASAASPTVAQLLGQAGASLAAASGTTPAVTDVVPLPAGDPRGAVFAAGALPLVIGGIAVAVALALRTRSRAGRVGGAAVVALLAGLLLAAIQQYWLGALTGTYLANAGVMALSIGAMSLMLLGLHNLLGLPGLGLGAAVILLLGNPLSGVTTAPELLPSGWSTLGQLLPPGASGTALRSTAFFDGAGGTTALLALSGWVILGLALAAVPRRTVAADTSARPHETTIPATAGPSEAT